MTTAKRQARVRAPQLYGAGGWIGTGGRSYGIGDFRGRVVLLDFWTSCCVNCLHVLDELRPLEQRFADVLVVVGVHSPKFPHETDHAAVVDAVERHDVRHPVLDDPDRVTWSQYAVRAWPTLCLVDPEGYVVHVARGEGHGSELERRVEQLVAEHEARGTLRRGPLPAERSAPAEPPAAAPTALRFPSGLLPLPDGDLLVADTAHAAVVRLAADGETERCRYGTGERGLRDGAQPRFTDPRGLCLLPSGLVLVADTGNHCLRTLDLATGEVRTVAGTGRPWRPGDPQQGPARAVPLSSPWDVCWWHDRLVVAAAGTHQLLAYDGERVEVLAGTRAEGLRDGNARQAYLAQPSGLAPGPDRLWFVDAESSALRWYREGQVGTAVGTGLFAFGHQDGPARAALLQHPLGVCLLPDGSVLVCDTYNGALRRYDPSTDAVTTLAGGLAEPTAAAVVGDELLVVASAAHRLERPLPPGGLRAGQRLPVRDVGPQVDLDVGFAPAVGQHLDDREGPPARLEVSATPGTLLQDGAGRDAGLTRTLRLAPGEGVLQVVATVATCDDQGEHPACTLVERTWSLPVRVVPDGPSRLPLLLTASDL